MAVLVFKDLAFALALACLEFFREDLGRRFLESRVWRNLIHVEVHVGCNGLRSWMRYYLHEF